MALRSQTFASTARNSENLRRSQNSAVKNPPKKDASSNRNAAKPAPQEPGSRARKLTFAEHIPGVQIEAVSASNAPGCLWLCIKDSKTIQIRSCLAHDGITYLPGLIPPGLGQLVRFARRPSESRATEKLQSEMQKFLSKYVDQDTQTINVLVAFVLASWFIECFEVAPALWLHGPDAEVCTVLRLLNILCYHPVLLRDLDVAALRTLPFGLRVTLLIAQPDLARGVEKALLNSERRHFCFARGKQAIDIFGARAVHCNSLSHEIGLVCRLDPARRHLACLSESDEEAASQFFQADLLAYRMSHYADVQKFEVDSNENYVGLEDEIKAWLAAIPRGSDLEDSVLRAFAERSAETESARFEDPTCLVAEAALLFCHKESTKFFYIRELAEVVNDLLKGRHADVKFEDRKIGAVLRNVGIHATRVTKGFRVNLSPEMRQRIHAVATAYRVLSAQPDVVRCADCKMPQ